MATKQQLRRAYVDLLMTTGQLSGIEALFGEVEEFDLGRYEGEDRLRTLENARNLLLEGEDGRDEDSAPALSPSDRLRAFAALVHNDRTNPGFVIPSDELHQVTARHMARDGGDADLAPLTEALNLVSDGVDQHGTFDLATVVARMPAEHHEKLVAHVGEQVVHSVTRGCDVDTIPMSDGKGSALRIEAHYLSERPVGEFEYPANPLHWPKCNAFFSEMNLSAAGETPLEPPPPGVGDPDHTGYRATVQEIVDFGYMTVETWLDVVYYIRSTGKPIAVGMTFDLSQSETGDGKIDTDYGHLTIVEANGGSRVTTSKTLRFTSSAGQGGRWAMGGGEWACHLGWLDTMEQMNRCRP